MFNTEYFTNRILDHFTPKVGEKSGLRQYGRTRLYERMSDTDLKLNGHIFRFYINKEGLEIVIEKEDIRDFGKKIKAINTREFWQDQRLTYVKQKKNKYLRVLGDLEIKIKGGGNYRITAKFKSENKDHVISAVLNSIIKPTLYSLGKED